MQMSLHGKNLTGVVAAISAKSMAHRLLICAALSQSPTRIQCEQESNDICATVACLQSLGASIERLENNYVLTPISMNVTRPTSSSLAELPCSDSGSTLRFMLPVVAALGQETLFLLKGRLPHRPLSPLYEELVRHGAILSPTGQATLSVKGKLKAGSYTLAGDISSQYFSGLLFALPLLEGPSKIHIQGRLESRQYIDLTLQALAQCGISVQETQDSFIIEGGQSYHAPECTIVEGDWSNAAFWLCAGALCERGIECTHLNMDSLQGDKEILYLLEAFGADVERRPTSVFVRKGALKGITIDAEHIPDLIPIVSVLASVAEGTTTIVHAKRLRLKESDRLESVCAVLRLLGANIAIHNDGLCIEGVSTLQGGRVSSCGDHRIAMMAAIASTVCRHKVIIEDALAVEKSYPSFYKEFSLLGGSVEELC